MISMSYDYEGNQESVKALGFPLYSVKQNNHLQLCICGFSSQSPYCHSTTVHTRNGERRSNQRIIE